MKKFYFSIITLIIFSVFIVLVLETFVRLFYPEIPAYGTSKELYAERVYGGSSGLAAGKSGYSMGAPVNVSQYGFRSCSVEIDTSKKNWLLIGDSVTMGIGVKADSTFAGILQSRTDSLNILNASLLGYKIEDYLNVFKTLVIEKSQALKIERVSIFWCLNDIYTDVADVEIPGGKIRYLLSDFLMFIRIHSRSYQFLKALVFDRAKSYYRFDAQFYDQENKSFKNAVQRFEKIQLYCNAANISFDVILLPYEYQLRKNSEDNFQPQKLMRGALRKLNIKTLNPLTKVANGLRSKDLYLFGDGIHFSNTGHRLIAGYLLSNAK